ncbi:MAG: dTDP-4-dehydrorhamnose reductase [Deinococcota bacterium]
MNIAVLAAQGQLGSDVAQVLNAAGHDVQSLGRDVDILDEDGLQEAFSRLKPNAVINCAAYTKVDDCEDQTLHAFHVNAVGALNVARASAEQDAHLVHISTDYVFDGTQGQYTEHDVPRPINVYGSSKWAGENLVQQVGGRWAVVRVSSVYGKAGNGGRGGNFIETILKRAQDTGKLNVVNDIYMSPTYTRDAAAALGVLIKEGFTGLTHLSSFERVTWYDFAKAAVEMTRVQASVTPVPASTYPTKATRPKDSSLTTIMLPDDAEAKMQPWQDALRAYLTEKHYL